ncbi:MFS general substrate transporter [Teratosphaeria destructans]|uniref:MFS general substrate transporter n=1 Tax=Teratosphaeria destructans TaxID=418781 RepID=A0A9W7SSA1_9PEZI|nr:MFS general substrate transporter [Teratosphaeria destructans]
MQSFLQYRRLRRRVHAREKAEQKAPQLSPQTSSSDPGTHHADDAGDGDDSTSPRDWSMFHRYRLFAIVWLLVFTQGWVSTCQSNVATDGSRHLHVSETAYALLTALFFLGIALGALVAGPLSETFGRNSVYLQPDVSIYGGTLADLFDNEERRSVWPSFALSPLLGPILAPVAGGWISGHIDWRWTLWIGLILAGAAFLLALLFLPETFGPVLMQWKSRHLRSVPGHQTDKTPPQAETESLGKRLKTNATRPLVFFTSEPIVIFLGSYLVLVFVINFSFLNGLDFIFKDTYGLSEGLTSLDFLSITVGVLIDVAATPLYTRLVRRANRRQCRAFVRHKPAGSADDTSSLEVELALPPELSLIRAAIAAPFLPVSLFWLGWTNYADINPASGYVATIFFGYSLSAIFISSYQYIIDGYEKYSSSALASITMARYVVSAGMVVATRPMYQGIGVQFVMTIVGSLALLLVPVPWLLLQYGDRVRAKSKFACSNA